MSSRTTFRFESGGVSFELSGPEEFVRRSLPTFVPLMSRVAGVKPAETEAAAEEVGTSSHDLRAWYAQHAGEGSGLTMQDHILVFAYWMRGFKKYIFTSEDIRRAFEELGKEEPKSLLQILGTLKRDHNLILGTERRGEYMLNTTGIDRARQVLGLPVNRTPRPEEAAAAPQNREASDIAAARALADI